MIKLNQEVITLGEFPNKESYLRIQGLPVRGTNTIQWMYEHDGELVKQTPLSEIRNRMI